MWWIWMFYSAHQPFCANNFCLTYLVISIVWSSSFYHLWARMHRRSPGSLYSLYWHLLTSNGSNSYSAIGIIRAHVVFLGSFLNNTDLWLLVICCATIARSRLSILFQAFATLEQSVFLSFPFLSVATTSFGVRYYGVEWLGAQRRWTFNSFLSKAMCLLR